MLRSSKACALLLFLLAASPAAGEWSRSAETCDDGLPQVLNVGLPRAGDLQELNLSVLRQAVSQRLTDLYEPPRDRCAGKRRLQVNIAIGCDYQILDWLGQGLIDVAVVPDLSLYLLQRDQGDQVKLRELPVAAKAPEDPLVSREYRLRSWRFAGGTPTPRADPEQDFESFRWQLWCGLFKERHGRGSLPDADRKVCSDLKPEYPIALTSHLSTGGFLRPVSATARWLVERLRAAQVDGEAAKSLTDRFWTAFFDNARFTLDGTLRDEERPRTGIEIAADGIPPAKPPTGPLYQDHVVITAQAANAIFPGKVFPPPSVKLEPELTALWGGDAPPAAFRSLLVPEPYFGVRTFAFTVDETIGLLRQHQKTSGPGLALVLPGGGVKAVYQSQLVDSLYENGKLKKFLTTRAPRPDTYPLDVNLVIG